MATNQNADIEHKYSIWEFYHLFDLHMEQVIRKADALFDDAAYLSIEELVVELYSCFMRTSTVVRMLEEYDDFNKYYFLNGRESKDEEYYKKLCVLSRKRLHVMSEWKENNFRFDSKFDVPDSAFPHGYKLAKRNEKEENRKGIEKFESLDETGKVKRNIECLDATTSLGVPIEFLKKMGIDTSDLSKMDLARKFEEINILDKPEVRDRLSKTHVELLISFHIYDNLYDHIMKHLCECMSKQGWNRLAILDDDDLKFRFDEMQQIIELTPEYKEYRDNLFVEDLLDESELTLEKLKAFKTAFVAKYKSEEIIKVYKLKKHNLPELLRTLVAKKFDAKEFEKLFYYLAVLKEIEDYNSTAPVARKELSTNALNSINIIMGNVELSNNYNIDKNFAPMIDNHDGGIIAKPETKELNNGTK